MKIVPALLVSVLLLVLAAVPPGALASMSANWGTGVQAPLPANAASSPRVSLRSVSCASPGNCVAGGEYTDSSDERQGLLLSETAGVWGIVELESGVFPSAVSCPSAGDCTAIGGGHMLSETEGVWGSATEVAPPANAKSRVGLLSHLSCPSAGNCTAAGGYTDTSGHHEGLLVTETEGTWGTGVEASLPANADPEINVYIEGLSCASPGNCTAVGEYYDGAVDEPEIFLLIETEGTWGTAVQAEPPANAHPNWNTIVKGVSCGSVGNCAVVGEYFDASGEMQGLLLNETEGKWGRGVEARLPANASPNPGPFIEEVQCASAGNCTAVGSYIDSSENGQGLLLTESAGTWDTGVEAPLPAGSRSGPSLLAGSLSCPSAGDCGYVDGYRDSSERLEGLLLTQSQGTWAPALQAKLPLNAGPEPEVLLRSVSCATPGNCTAVGEYTDSSEHRQGLLLTAAPTTANLSASGPLGGAFVGSAIPTSSISAALDGGSAPSGTVTFTVFGPQSSPPSSCASGGTVVGTASASGDGTYHPSTSFTPPSPGEYWWYASYGGDAGDEPATSVCGGASMAVTTVVSKAMPTLSASGPLGGVAGSPISASSISAALAGGSAPTGAIAFTVFGPQSSPPSSCTSGGTTVGTASVNGNGAYQSSAAFTPAAPGEYWWYAGYGGDAGDEPTASACGPLMAQTLVAVAPTTGAGSGSGSSGSGSGVGSGTGAKTPAPTLSSVKLSSKSSTGQKGIALKLALPQPATIEVLIAQVLKGHKLKGVCKPTAKKGKSCTTTVGKRTLTFSGSVGSNTFKLKLAGLGKGFYTATIIAESTNTKSNAVTLTFAITQTPHPR